NERENIRKEGFAANKSHDNINLSNIDKVVNEEISKNTLADVSKTENEEENASEPQI
mgnify:CR=1